MRIKDFRLACAFVLAAGCSFLPARVLGGNDAMTSTRLGMSRNAESVRNLGADELVRLLTRSSESSASLASVKSNPEYWVNELSLDVLLKAVWVAGGLCESNERVAYLFGPKSIMSPTAATNCLVGVVAFDELLKRKDKAVWDYVSSRSDKDASVLDACLVGRLLWGGMFDAFPTNSVRYRSASDLSEVKDGFEELPKVRGDEWRKLVQGKNGIYRWLSSKALRNWSKGGAASVPDELAFDPFFAVRNEWRTTVDHLPPDERVARLEKFVKLSPSRMPPDDLGREMQNGFSRGITERLRQTKEKMRDDNQATNRNVNSR